MREGRKSIRKQGAREALREFEESEDEYIAAVDVEALSEFYDWICEINPA